MKTSNIRQYDLLYLILVAISISIQSGFSQDLSPQLPETRPSITSGAVVVNSTAEVEMERMRIAEEVRKMERDEIRFKEQIILLQKKLATASGTAIAPKELTLEYRTFISANPDDIETSEKYYALLKSLLNDLVPKSPYKETSYNDATSDPRNAEEKLHNLSQFPEDDRICNTIKAQIAAVRSGAMSNHNRKIEIDARLAFLEKELKRLTGNFAVASEPSRITGRLNNSPATLALMAHEIKNTEAEIVQLRTEKMTRAKGGSKMLMKVQFQQLIVQLAMQQRYIHSLIACGFYRLFTPDVGMMKEAYVTPKEESGSGNNTEESDSAGGNSGTKKSNTAPALPVATTVTGLETILLNRLRDAMREREAIDNMLKANQLSDAERLLLKMTAVAKYQPELHTIPYEDRQRLLKQSGDIQRLSDALNSRDYEGMLKLVETIESNGSDVGMSDIKVFAKEHPRKALFWANQAELALEGGDHKAMQSLMEAAMRIAPLDKEVSAKIEDLQSSAISKKDTLDELKRVVKNGDYRTAFDRKDEFASLANSSDEGTLKADYEALIDLEAEVETALKTCDEFEDRSSYPDAWVALEECKDALNEDPRLLKRRLDVSAKCSEFVAAYTNAQEHEEKGATALALAWYLTARVEAPSTPKIKESIDQLSNKILNQ
ncbi:MAG: hypothetical protein P1V20_10935 [Verrucomicrobiales bacterium]|nr:hypothetical protein [Verrucomicrobiales bacterium]